MFGTLLRTMLVIVVVVAAVAFFAGYRTGAPPRAEPSAGGRPIVGMTGRMNEQPVRERATGTLERAAEASRRTAAEARDALSDAALAAKISSKMALDDLVQARSITVRVDDGVVTLQGTVRSDEERQRALGFARETEGVQTVHDRLELLENTAAAEGRARR